MFIGTSPMTPTRLATDQLSSPINVHNPIKKISSNENEPRTVVSLRLGEKLPTSQSAHPFSEPSRVRMEEVASLTAAIARLSSSNCAGLYLEAGGLNDTSQLVRLLQNDRILNGMPEGVALIDSEKTVTWANDCLRGWSQLDNPVGNNIYSILGDTQILGPDFCPFHTALATGNATTSTLQTDDNRYYQVHVSPLKEAATEDAVMVATISDITAEIVQHHKLNAIHQAGQKLTDLQPDEIFAMDTQARIDLLKDNIRHYTADLLNVEVIEIRLLEQSSGNLIPLLSVGFDQVAADRKLLASPHGYGVTGYVAATGKSYLCVDASKDPLYLQAFQGSASSMTVPILLHDAIIGTINVESNKLHAFDESDLQFLQIFARDVAVALNTLELLVAQRNNAAQQSCEAIHSAVALPVDQILNDAVSVIEKHLGNEQPEIVERLQRILTNARDIRRVIQSIGQKMAPSEALPAGCTEQLHAKLRGKRVLIVDPEIQIVRDAHNFLEKFGCMVESAHNGDEAVSMFRNSGLDAPYDVVISAISLPDYSGYQLMLRLKQFVDPVPLALMTGFGWDPGHTIVKARQAGLPAKALMYKPFKLAQILSVVETVLDHQNSGSAG
jgi:two-component system, sensor histidine kinase SagS